LRASALNRRGAFLRTATLLFLAVFVLTLAAGAARASALQSPVGSGLAGLAPVPPPQPDLTRTIITPNPGVVTLGSSITLTALVSEVNGLPSFPTGAVTWGDGGANGTFTATSCDVASVDSLESECSVGYYPAGSSIGSSISITAGYSGDALDDASTGQAALTVLSATVTTVTPNSVGATSGTSVTFTATVNEPSGASKTSPQGTLVWSDGGVGGTFTGQTCTLLQVTNSSASCSVNYSPPASATVAFTATVTASFPGDQVHGPSSGTATLAFTPSHVPMKVNFAIVGTSNGVLPPTFTYSLSNKTITVTLTVVPTTYSADVNSRWFVPNQLGNSSQSEAWNLEGGSQGIVTYSYSSPDGGTTLTFTYYHQYLVDLGYAVQGGTAGASVPPFVTYTSFGLTRQEGAPGTTWVDPGTSYAYPALLPGSLGNVRWIAQNVSGIVSRPADLSPTYYHQYSLSVSFAVKNGPSNPTAPLFFADSMGSRFNASLASLSSNVWLDAGSQYTLTDPLVGGNSTVRWSAGSASSGTVTDSNIAVTYYRQYELTASFKTSDDSVATQVSNGISSPVLAPLSGFEGNRNVTIPLGTEPRGVWLDSGSSYSISKVLLTLPTERWIATAALNGTVALNSTASQTYYHGYLLTVSDSDSGTSTTTPSVTYTTLGAQTQSPMTLQGSTIWADGGTKFFVADTSAGDRWYAPNSPDGLASTNMTVTLYHQYAVDASVKVEGGSQPAQTTISGVSGGQHVNELLSTEPQTWWLDSGTSYSIPQTLLQLTNERWIASATIIGTLNSPTTITQEYYHQVLLNMSASGFPSGHEPLVSLVSFGANATTRLVPIASDIWADSGTMFTVQNVINGTAGERWYSGFPALNLNVPFQARLQYLHQFLLTYTFTTVDGQMRVPPTMTGETGGTNSSAPITTNAGQLWLDSGSHWRFTLPAAAQDSGGSRWVSGSPTQGTMDGPATVHFSYLLQYLVATGASPASGGTVSPGGWYNATGDITLAATPGGGWTLAGWNGTGRGAYSGANATFSIPVVSSFNETAQFYPGLTVASSKGGSVKYTTGGPFQNVAGGQSVQTFVQGNGSVTLQASPSFLFKFVKWSGVESANANRLTLRLNAPTQVEAVFALDYLIVIGIPAVVFGCAVAVYLARRRISASGRHLIRSLKEATSS